MASLKYIEDFTELDLEFFEEAEAEDKKVSKRLKPRFASNKWIGGIYAKSRK